jgi:hypothetical protein
MPWLAAVTRAVVALGTWGSVYVKEVVVGTDVTMNSKVPFPAWIR